MKKVRLSLKRGSKPWSFILYDSAESAYFLKDEPLYPDGFEEEYRKIITLNKGDILEVEWVGSEWVFEDEHEDFLRKPVVLRPEVFDKYDKVRVGKITPIKGTEEEEKMGYLEVYAGWTFGGTVPWSAETTSHGLKITEVKGRIRSKFDFPKLFSDPTIGLLQQEDPEQPMGDVLN